MAGAGGVIIRVTSAAGVTVTTACWVVPFRGPAVTVALPTPRVRTGKAAVADPAGTVTVPGTSTLRGSLLARGTTVASGWVGLRVTVRVPGSPFGRLRVAGVRAVRVGGS